MPHEIPVPFRIEFCARNPSSVRNRIFVHEIPVPFGIELLCLCDNCRGYGKFDNNRVSFCRAVRSYPLPSLPPWCERRMLVLSLEAAHASIGVCVRRETQSQLFEIRRKPRDFLTRPHTYDGECQLFQFFEGLLAPWGFRRKRKEHT